MGLDLGITTGIIGTISGVAGSVMGFIAFRHSRQIISADRRLELEKLRNTVQRSSEALDKLIPRALSSKKATLAAKGLLRSSFMDMFQKTCQTDTERASELAQSIPAANSNFKLLSRTELEDMLVQLDRTKGWIDELLEKYETSFQEDLEWGRRKAEQR